MASKLSTQDIINKGEYLEPDFDPSSLTVVHLRGLLHHHDVTVPGNATKAVLIKAFQDNIVPKARQLRKTRNDNASMNGNGSDIFDVATGEYIQPIERKRSTRKSMVELPQRVPSASPTRKSRKSLGIARTSSHIAKTEDNTNSERERLVSSKIEDADESSRKGRRVSQKWGTGDETSMWEDTNPFQRGSPPAQKPRKSRGRPSGHDFAATSGDQSIFPVAGSLNLPKFPTSKHTQNGTPERTSWRASAASSPQVNGGHDDDFEPVDEYPYVEGNSQIELVGQKIASLGDDIASGTSIARRRTAPKAVWPQFILSILFVVAATALWSYKRDSAVLGYCDTDSDSNSVVRQHLQEIKAADECKEALIRQAKDGIPADSHLESCQTSFLPRATKCTACPPHAICSSGTVSCEPAYMLRTSSVSSVPFMDAVVNGIPGFGSVAFPVRCVPDVRRRQNIGRMAKAIENKLANLRGQRICQGVRSTGGDAQDAAVYGMNIDDLRASFHNRVPQADQDRMRDIFDSAISELKASGLLVSVRDIRGKEHFASIREETSYLCQGKLKLVDAWKAWQRSIFGTIFGILLVLIARSNLASKAVERRRVKGLVKEALERVREQEAKHYLDSVTYPTSSLTSLQLRDELMHEEYSIAKRAKLWEQVEKIVEENSNVRSNVELTSSGDEGRVWTWIGSSGRRAVGTLENAGGATGRLLM
ncbi:inner nuclear membrane protein enriched at telomere/subtelomere region [Serendipita sp. 399]|nr:inner nuclear membrane protein enriched at telomere/subtelomere region [Serendipita sp. 399]